MRFLFALDIKTFSIIAIFILLLLSFVIVFTIHKYENQRYLVFLVIGNLLRIVLHILIITNLFSFSNIISLIYNFSDSISVFFYIMAVLLIINEKLKLYRLIILINVVNILIIVIANYIFDDTNIRRISVSITIAIMLLIALYEISHSENKHHFKFCGFGRGILILFLVLQLYIIVIVILFPFNDLTILQMQQHITINSIMTFLVVLLFNVGVMLLSIDVLNIRIWELSIKDSLTNIYNRRFFFELFDNYILSINRITTSFFLILIDIDNFKKVNDIYGHIAGDEVLSKFAGFISNEIRESDVIARYGGEEFIILLKDTNLRDAELIMSRLLSGVQQLKFKRTDVSITFSGGASIFYSDSLPISVEQMISDIDEKLYRAKRNGKNQIEYNKENS